MSENEKRLRQYLEMFTSESAEQSLDDLDALLAEHRAEVDALKAERDGFRRTRNEEERDKKFWKKEAEKARTELAADRSKALLDAGWIEPFEAGTLRAEVEALKVEVKQGQDEAFASACRAAGARDAALEEAAAAIDGGQVTGSLALGGWYRRYADRIRALKSRPAERYLRESEVRRAIKEVRHASGDMTASDERDVLRRLGVALDADDDKKAIERGEANQTYWTGKECEDEARTSQNAMAVEDTRQTCTCAGQGICEWCDAQVSP